MAPGLCVCARGATMDFASWRPLAMDRRRVRLEALFDNNDNNIVANGWADEWMAGCNLRIASRSKV